MAETWLVFKTNGMSTEGWEHRKLMPSGSLTDILTEEWDYSVQPRIPQPGDHVREYVNLHDPGNGVTHGRDGDWVVAKTQQFSSFETDTRIVVCYCEYQPTTSEWQELKRGASVADMLEAATAK